MIKVNVGISIALVISIFTCMVLTYFWIDRSISLGYMRQLYEMEKNSVKILQKLISLEWKGMPEEQLQARLESAAKEMTDIGAVIKKQESILWFNQVAFIIKKGKLEKIDDSNIDLK